jgi:hypothetical protein
VGDAEVGDHHPAGGTGALEHDVVRLDVAVDDAAAVGHRQSLGDRGHDQCRDLGQEAPAMGLEHRPQRRAVDQLDDDVRRILAAGRREVVDLHDAWMLEGGGGLGLAPEPFGRVAAGGDRQVHHLDGDGAAELHVAGAENGGHRSLAHDVPEVVAAELRPGPGRGAPAAWTVVVELRVVRVGGVRACRLVRHRYFAGGVPALAAATPAWASASFSAMTAPAGS